MNADESDPGDPAGEEYLIEQSRLLITRAHETLNRAELLAARAQAGRRDAPAAPVETPDRSALMASFRDLQGARTELVTAIQLTTQAMHLTTRSVQAHEKLIQAHVEWSRQVGK